MADEFNFGEFFPPFSGMLSEEFGSKLLQALVLTSKTWHTVYEEHVRNGFSEDQAMVLTLSLQKEIIYALSYFGAEVGRVMIPKAMEGRPKQKGDDD